MYQGILFTDTVSPIRFTNVPLSLSKKILNSLCSHENSPGYFLQHQQEMFVNDHQKSNNLPASKQKNPCIVYTDGSFASSVIGTSAILQLNQQTICVRKRIVKTSSHGAFLAEMMAIESALALIHNGSHVIIRTDSINAIAVIKAIQSKTILNSKLFWVLVDEAPDLLKSLYHLLSRVSVTLEKVTAHSDNIWNNLADRQAKAATKQADGFLVSCLNDVAEMELKKSA